MTLILTAICKDGISICADRRYKITNDDGSVVNEDTHNKIYRFKQIPYVILNHGINKINGKDWKEYCSKYEELGSWKGKNQPQIVDDFKKFIEGFVNNELSRYKDSKKHAVGFLLGGKPKLESKYKVSEIHWLLENGEIIFTPPNVVHTRKKNNLIFTGDDDIKDYLKKYLEENATLYPKTSKAERAEKKLIKIFKLAVKEKQRLGNNEFSNKYDTSII